MFDDRLCQNKTTYVGLVFHRISYVKIIMFIYLDNKNSMEDMETNQFVTDLSEDPEGGDSEDKQKEEINSLTFDDSSEQCSEDQPKLNELKPSVLNFDNTSHDVSIEEESLVQEEDTGTFMCGHCDYSTSNSSEYRMHYTNHDYLLMDSEEVMPEPSEVTVGENEDEPTGRYFMLSNVDEVKQLITDYSDATSSHFVVSKRTKKFGISGA